MNSNPSKGTINQYHTFVHNTNKKHIMKKKNIFFVLLICFINSSCKIKKNKQTSYKIRISILMSQHVLPYISGTITGEMNPYVM